MKIKTKSELFGRINSRCRNVTGVLLLALLLANPFSGSGQGVIAVDVHTGVDLNTIFPAYDSVIVAPGVSVDNALSGTIGLSGNTHPWSVTVGSASNPTGATVNGDLIGISLLAGGNITNSATSFISGGTSDGVHITGGTGIVDNKGTISAGAPDGDDGVDLDAGGSVINHAGATIFGNDDGISTHGTVDVLNNGTITANNDDGVNLHDGGSLVNNGTISGGDNGVEIFGGIALSEVNLVNPYVLNTSSITGLNGDGVQMHNGGNVVNLDNATITGGDDGVYIEGGYATLVNTNGSIVGQNDEGVRFKNGGTVENLGANASITGNDNGVQISGSTGTVYNEGTITGNGRDGVRLDAGGSVYNYSGGSITGDRYGVEISGGFAPLVSIGNVNNALVNNYGSITGNGRSGVRIRDGGTVQNLGGNSSIYGNHDGVHISGGEGLVYNDGTITGYGDNGVQLDDAGTVNNWGTITGSRYGVEIAGTIINETQVGNGNALVNNDGSITGYGRSGVRMRDGGTVNNGYDGGWMDSSATITGNHDGVHISGGSGYVDNYYYATITGQGDNGVQFDNGGTVNNYGGTIQGAYGQVGIETLGVEENGNGSGVQITGAGNVNNYGGNISGGTYGVYVSGGVANVYNSGNITGYGNEQVMNLFSVGGYGTAVLFEGDYNDTLTLDTGSALYGDADGGAGTDAVILQGSGSEDNDFLNFENLTMQGGHWTLTGDNVFSNAVAVNGGELSIGDDGIGRLTTPIVNVGIDGSLGGSGSVFAIVNNMSGGILTPGNSIGTLTINGSLTNNSDYEAEVDGAGNSDLVQVDGTATLEGGTVYATPVGNELFAASTTYTILTATNGIVGVGFNTNAPVTTEFYPYGSLFLTGLVFQDSTNVYLTLNRSAFSGLAKTFNQKAVSGTFDAVVDSAYAGLAPGVSNLVREFMWLPSTNAALAALDSLSGEIHGSIGMLEVLQQRMFNDAIGQRMESIREGTAGGEFASNRKPTQLASLGGTVLENERDLDRPWGVWLRGYGTFGELDSDGNAAGGCFTASGLNGGLEYQLNHNLLIGFAAGFASIDFSNDRWASADADNIHFAGYANYSQGDWYVDGVFSFGILNTETERHISVGDIQQLAKGNYDGMAFSMSAEGGYAFHLGEVVDLQPFVGLNYTSLSQDGFNESGTAGLDGMNYGLHVSDVEMDSLQGSLGIRLIANIEFQNGMRLTPQLHAVFQHEFMDSAAEVTSSFNGGSPSQVTRGVELGDQTGVVGANVSFAFSKAISAFVGYDVRLNENLTSQNVAGGVTFSW